MTTREIDALADIEAQLLALGDQGDVPTTLNAQAAWAAAHSKLTGQRQTIRAAMATLAAVAPKITAETQWIADCEGWRKTLSDELLAAPRPRSDIERGRIQNLELSIRCLDYGRAVADGTGWTIENLRLGDLMLMRASGYEAVPAAPGASYGLLPWHGSIPVAQARLKELVAQRDDAQRQLDAALADPAPRIVGSGAVAYHATAEGTGSVVNPEPTSISS